MNNILESGLIDHCVMCNHISVPPTPSFGVGKRNSFSAKHVEPSGKVLGKPFVHAVSYTHLTLPTIA